ncbi:MAG: nuclear transport factor 2 family protein [Pseudomonadales bacterium]|nr:nuclear transport factor 2 family protein [Pseudomonadales bacterium]
MTPQQEKAFQDLLDKQAIQELIHVYCNAADRRDYDKMRALYHEDATDDHGGFFQGLAMDFIDQLPVIQESMDILHHNVTTVNIKFEEQPGGATKAEGEVYVLAFHKVKSDQGAFDLLVGGRYLDKYEKRNDVWKFSHRAVVADWVNVHDPSIVDLTNPLIAESKMGTAGEDDPSYAFFELLKRGER